MTQALKALTMQLQPFVSTAKSLFDAGLPSINIQQTFICADLNSNFTNFDHVFMCRYAGQTLSHYHCNVTRHGRNS